MVKFKILKTAKMCQFYQTLTISHHFLPTTYLYTTFHQSKMAIFSILWTNFNVGRQPSTTLSHISPDVILSKNSLIVPTKLRYKILNIKAG